ncbi:MAG: hypothetical protein AAAFM81_07090 [Pseudomonadota bacterium]
MNTIPKWFLPLSIVALLWNLMGCAAYLSDAMISADDIAAMDAAQQALYALERPAWSIAGTAIAVWLGALGCLGLILKKAWAMPLLIVSLIGVIVQDLWLFILSDAAKLAGNAVFILQGLVFVIAVGLVVLATKAKSNQWLS